MLELEYEGLAALLADEKLRDLPPALSGAFSRTPEVDVLCGQDMDLDDLLAKASGECDYLGDRLQVFVAGLAKRAEAARLVGHDPENAYAALSLASQAFCRFLGKEGKEAQKWCLFRCLQSFSLILMGKLADDLTVSRRLLDRGTEVAEEVVLNFPEAENPELWARGQFHLGFAHGARVIFANDKDESRRILELSREHFDSAMRIWTFDAAPKQWSFMQSYLGETQIEYSRFAEKSEGYAVLARAAKAQEAALKILGRETSLGERIRSQTTLGNLLMRQADFVDDRKRRSLFASAGRIFKEALRGLTKEKEPLAWAHAHGGLAGAILRRAELESKDVPLIIEKAVESYEKAMQVFSRDKYPEHFAAMSAATGGALVELAHAASGKKARKYMERSIDAYEKAIPAVSSDKDPELWVSLRFCLSDSLRQLGQECSDDDLAASHFRRSAELGEVVLKTTLLQNDMNAIVTMRSFLGMIYAEMADRSGDEKETEELFEKSIRIYEEALECCKGEAADRREEIEDLLIQLRKYVLDTKYPSNVIGFRNEGGRTLH